MPGFTKKTAKKNLNSFVRHLLKIKTEEQLEAFLSEIMTAKEIVTLSLRWRLLELLRAGQSQRGIAKTLGISLCKITRGSKILNKKGSITKQILDTEEIP
ncbi:MAG: trp operon repressor, partial [Elusimicrobiota bacterium]|nr:trp operon repressor [Elusimicrobiota bacterium]